MENKVHTFSLNIDWELIRLISQIDRFDASWTTIEKKEGQSIEQLKTIATVRSVGASTRIEGSKMSDEEVEVLLKEIDITKIADRDSQEVVGYYETHLLVKCALFAYGFVSIHPFQDGNGRLSRLLSTLLLLKQGYKWIQYVSFEHEIESRKTEYYRVLRSCQAQRPNEDVTDWIRFFFDTLGNIQTQLMIKLESKGIETRLSPREKSILTFIENNPGCKSGNIAKKLGIPSPTVKRILPELIDKNLIEKFGTGPGTNYSIK